MCIISHLYSAYKDLFYNIKNLLIGRNQNKVEKSNFQRYREVKKILRSDYKTS